MARKLSEREWEAWQEFLTQPLAKELFRALAGHSDRLKAAWLHQLWTQDNPDPSGLDLLKTRQTALAYHRLSLLGSGNSEAKHVIEELLHDDEHERDKPD